MLTLWTGKPGSGKTLNCLYELAEELKKKPRPVFWTNINGLNIPDWKEFPEPKQWNQLPAGSLLIIDEVQKYFPVRRKDDAPDYITEFSTHRHLGLDFIFITQDPMLVDVWLRRLVNRHCHVVRPYGAKFSTIYEWQQVTDMGEPGAKRQALKRTRPFPKHVYDWYKSADLHTQQARPPWSKLVGVVAAGVAALAVGVWVIQKVLAFGDSATGKETETAAAATQAVQIAKAAAAQVDSLVEIFKPRIPGLPWSAGFYQEKVIAAEMPYVSGCMRIQTDDEDLCRCNDQQGTNVPVNRFVCMSFLAAGGSFDWSGQKAADDAALIAAIEARQNGASMLSADTGGGSGVLPSMGGGGSGSPMSSLGFN